MANIVNNAYNRFVNLDSIEDRIIYYLITPYGKTEKQLKYVHQIWRLLYYKDINSLNLPLPNYEDIVKLICNDNIAESPYRIFRSSYLSEIWTEECTMLRIYLDSVSPVNHITAYEYIGIDILCHTKIINVKVADDDDSSIIGEYDGVQIKVETKNRLDVMLKSILYLLNGATIQGVGTLQFNAEHGGKIDQARLALWNKSSFEGFKVILSSIVSGAEE